MNRALNIALRAVSRRSLPRLVAILLLVATTVALSSCGGVRYYAQAIGGHLEVMRQARPIEDVAGDPATPPVLRDKLGRAQAMRDFAVRHLDLPDNASYRRYADVGRPFVVWNVIATPEFSVTPVESCYPVAGCVSYRGWYRESRARADAEERAREGLDVRVAGVPAYSTLGWFDDPLLNTFLVYPEAEVARLMFHELAHQVVYLSGDTTFNESFAVAVEEEGVRRWLDAGPDANANAKDGERERYEALSTRRGQFVALITVYRDRLKAFYRQTDGDGGASPAQARTQEPSAAERRAGKARLFAELDRDYDKLKSEWGGFAGYDRIMGRSAPTAGGGQAPAPAFSKPNNALLAAIVSYSEWLPAFRALLRQNAGDMKAFYREVKALAGLPRAEREQRLRELAPAVNAGR